MCRLLIVALVLSLVGGQARAEDKKQAPQVVLKSPDGKKSYDLAKLTAEGPVLVRLTCACSGCDAELPYFQALQAAYETKGLKTLAAFKEPAEAAESYTVQKDIHFLWVADPKGELWKTFNATAMPTNILIDKGGQVVKVVAGCKADGANAQVLSKEIARLLQTESVKIETKPKKAKEEK